MCDTSICSGSRVRLSCWRKQHAITVKAACNLQSSSRFRHRLRHSRRISVHSSALFSSKAALTQQPDLQSEALVVEQPSLSTNTVENNVVESAEVATATVDRAMLWKACIKLPMYSVGWMPVLVGCAAVYATTGTLPIARCCGLVLAAFLVIAWLNLSNDAFDAATGVDKTKPESIVNLMQCSPRAVLTAAFALLAVGVALICWLVTISGDMRAAYMLAAAIACGYVYQGPPFRLSYKGLGEPLCFAAFGPLATTAFYLAQLPPSNASSLVSSSLTSSTLMSLPSLVHAAALLIGTTTAIILFTSHFHQIDGDRANGKFSPLVRLGAQRGTQVLQVSVVATYIACLMAAVTGVFSWRVLACMTLSFPSAKTLLDYAAAHYSQPAKIRFLKMFATKWHIAFGGCLTAGLLASRLPF